MGALLSLLLLPLLSLLLLPLLRGAHRHLRSLSRPLEHGVIHVVEGILHPVDHLLTLRGSLLIPRRLLRWTGCPRDCFYELSESHNSM